MTFTNDKPNPARPSYLPDPTPGMLPSVGKLEDPMAVSDNPGGQDPGQPLEYGHWTTKPKLGTPSKTSNANVGAGQGLGGIPGLGR